jgi:hypothetical protein
MSDTPQNNLFIDNKTSGIVEINCKIPIANNSDNEDNEIDNIIKAGLENLKLETNENFNNITTSDNNDNEENNQLEQLTNSLNNQNIFCPENIDEQKAINSTNKSINTFESNNQQKGLRYNKEAYSNNSLEYNLSNINSPEIAKYLSPSGMVQDSLRDKNRKKIEDKQYKHSYLKQVVKGDKSSSSGSQKDNFNKRKKYSLKNNENLVDEEIAVLFENTLLETDMEIKESHLKSFLGKFKSIICTQIGSRTIQKSLFKTPITILNQLVEFEVGY